MTWTQEKIEAYHEFMPGYVASYNAKIDCADLALAALVDFAEKHELNIRLKSWDKGWKWYRFRPDKDDAEAFKKKSMMMLGALNVIDNTDPVNISMAKPGDLIMSKWSGSLGHTRIIWGINYEPANRKYKVTWYQGNLPPVVPEKREGYFSGINGVYGKRPRRWKFHQFDA